MSAAGGVDRLCDRLARTYVRAGGRRVAAFHLCGAVGMTAALVVTNRLAAIAALDAAVILALAGLGVTVFLALAMVTKLLVGVERLTYYHHEIAIFAASAALLALAQRPVLAYLDVLALGVGTVLACGRIGCLMVGCCHGRPSAHGIRYRHDHAALGFPAALVGVRLFPLQAVEAAAVAGIVAVGAAMLSRSAADGTALAWYVVAYGGLRFGLEFARGDAARPYWLGLSEAQWTSLTVIAATAGAEAGGVVPAHAALAATPVLAAVMAGIAVLRLCRLRRPECSLFAARHVEELAATVGRVTAQLRRSDERHAPPGVACTSLGVTVSAGTLATDGGTLRHYAVSRARPPLSKAGAVRLARLIVRLAKHERRGRVLRGRHGVFHVLVDVAPP